MVVSEKNGVTSIQMFLLLGPSGVGKSEIASRLQALNFIHLKIDQHHGFKANGLRHEWHQFCARSDPGPLGEALERRTHAAVKRGIFLSLPSTRVLGLEQVEIARTRGISSVLLWGSEELCKSARKSRDEAQGLPFDAGRYDKSNTEAFRVYGAADFDDLRIPVFDAQGAHRTHEEIIAAVVLRLLT